MILKNLREEVLEVNLELVRQRLVSVHLWIRTLFGAATKCAI